MATGNGLHQQEWIQNHIFKDYLILGYKSKKFDLDCEYIKKWIPELKDVKNADIHNWEKAYSKYDLSEINYLKPIVSYSEGRKRSVEMYRQVL